jgi:hypothetical protein
MRHCFDSAITKKRDMPDFRVITASVAEKNALALKTFSRQGFGCAEATASRSCVATVSCPIFFPISFPTSVEKR